MSKKTYIVIFSLLSILTLVESFFEQKPIFYRRPLPVKENTKSRQEIRKEFGGLPEAHELTAQEKQQHIRDAFIFSWEGYRKHSWGYDENKPVSNSARNTR